MKTLFKQGQYFDEDYYERGAETGKSLYSHYRWMPELTIPMCHHIAKYLELKETDKVLDFGCAKGFTVYCLRLLGYKAYGVDVSEYSESQIEEGTRKWCGVIKPQENCVRISSVIDLDNQLLKQSMGALLNYLQTSLFNITYFFYL